jgi:disulfide bond formation protein DsbB
MKKLCAYFWTEERLWLLFLLGSLGLVIAAFIFEYGFDAKPCKMCWEQRYGHWGMVAAGLVGLKLPVSFLWKRFMLLAPVLWSGYVAVYQSLGQLGLVELPASCRGNAATLSGASDLLSSFKDFKAAPDCASIDFTILGLSFAQWNAIVMLGFVLVIAATFMIKPKAK